MLLVRRRIIILKRFPAIDKVQLLEIKTPEAYAFIVIGQRGKDDIIEYSSKLRKSS